MLIEKEKTPKDMTNGELLENFVKLNEEKKQLKKTLAELKETTEELAVRFGPDSYLAQEKERETTCPTVFKIEECNGKFVYFEKFEIKVTKQPGDAKGSLARSDADRALVDDEVTFI